MIIEKNRWPLLIVALISIIYFTTVFIARKNYEFVGYIGVIIFFALVIVISDRKVKYPNYVLWSLWIWAIMHMAGGGVVLAGKRLYELMIFDVVGSPYFIFKYDQLVHIFGFFAATLALYYVLKPHLKNKFGWVAIGVVVVMAGLGAGALNEIVEFTTTVLVPETGVGGYENTSLDLVSNLIGALIAFVVIYFKDRK